MTVEQRDVYLFPPTHDFELEHHPFIVLSTREANEYEGTFVAVMITSSTVFHDDLSFDLEDEMFENPLPKKNSHARMHLITLCINEHIKGARINRMKPIYFKQLMKSIGDLVFNYDFTPLN
ncbi:MAG TPA: type II toxin-antitoxin system PemK/MazF family toxin [Puia sp.]|nr:type II toxin-antitoxin system PemK/MazF family toxin [Puia sp.]